MGQNSEVTIALIRHGQTDWNAQFLFQGRSDIPLNDVGRQQARDTAGALAETGLWDAIVSSPLKRARETASVIAEALGLELGPAYPDWVERDYGVHEGVRADRSLLGDPSIEPVASVIERGRRGLDEVSAAYPGKKVLIVAHGTIIRYTLNDIAGGDWQHPVIPGIVNGALSTVSHAGGEWVIGEVNFSASDLNF